MATNSAGLSKASRRLPQSRQARQLQQTGQLQLALRQRGRGGRRPNAGRKAGPRVSHHPREKLAHRFPVHVTLRLRPEVWNLRSKRCFRALCSAFARGRERRGFRLVHFSVQGNHLHLVVEAPDERGLARGMQGLAVRMAKRLNHVMGRHGPVFADRYHAHILRSPRETSAAVAYVLGNFARHRAEQDRPVSFGSVDPFCSAAPHELALTTAAQTWLLRGAS